MKILSIVAIMPTEEKPWAQPFVKSQIDSIQKLGIDVKVLNLTDSFGEGWSKYFKGIFRLRDLLQNEEFDLIHAHYSYCGFLGLFQRRLPLIVSLMGSDLGLPIMGTEDHNLRNHLERFSGRFVARFSDYVIVKSQEMAKWIPYCKNIQVIPNGVDFDLFYPMDQESLFERFNLPSNKAIVLFACNPENPRKNIALAKEAFDILDRKNPGKYYFWNVWKTSHTMMPFVLNAADVMVFTSLLEGSPNLIKESMACNLPIVSVPIGDVPEIITDAINCHIVDYDPIMIADKLHKVLASGSRSNGREMIDHLRLETIAHKIEILYKNVIDSQLK